MRIKFCIFILLLFACSVYAEFRINNSTFNFNGDVSFKTDGIKIISGAINCYSAKLAVSGNWENQDTFNAGTSTVTFEDSTNISTIVGNTIFYNFTCETPAKTLIFTAGSTQTITNTLTLTGTVGNLITLKSSVAGNKWYVSFPNSSQTVNYVNVKDADATDNTVSCYYSINSGNNNTYWIFLDATAPTGSPSTPIDAGVYSSSSTLTFNWTLGTGSDPDSDIVGYYLQIGTLPGSNDKFDGYVGNVTSYSVTGCVDGETYYARVKAKNEAGLYSDWSANSDGITVDLTAPSAPAIISETHPDSAKEYLDSNPVILLSSSTDSSDIAGYYYIFNQDTGTVPSASSGTYTAVVSSLSFTNIADGFWYLHIVTVDGAGNVSSEVAHYKIGIKTTINPATANTFLLSDGTKVEMPANAIDTATKLIITKPAEIPISVYNPDCKDTGIVKEIKLADPVILLKKEITITLIYTDTEIADIDEQTLKIACYNETNRNWKIIFNSIAYPDENKVVAKVNHLTLFKIVGYKTPSEEISGLSNYPNPFVAGSGKVTAIKYTLKENLDVEIKIYDLIGELVWEKKLTAGETGGVLGPDNEITWDGKNENGDYVSAGGYICLVKVGNKVEKTKIGVK
ncbi:MAG: FlgD immunoglobulin-like domain containing protein [Elusimicrobiota bacterium]